MLENQHYLIIYQMPSTIGKLSFCTIEPNVGVISVPDKRLNELERLQA